VSKPVITIKTSEEAKSQGEKKEGVNGQRSLRQGHARRNQNKRVCVVQKVEYNSGRGTMLEGKGTEGADSS